MVTNQNGNKHNTKTVTQLNHYGITEITKRVTWHFPIFTQTVTSIFTEYPNGNMGEGQVSGQL